MWIIGEVFFSWLNPPSPASPIYLTSLLDDWQSGCLMLFLKWAWKASRHCLSHYKIPNKLLTASQEGLRTPRCFSSNNLVTDPPIPLDTEGRPGPVSAGPYQTPEAQCEMVQRVLLLPLTFPGKSVPFPTPHWGPQLLLESTAGPSSTLLKQKK